MPTAKGASPMPIVLWITAAGLALALLVLPLAIVMGLLSSNPITSYLFSRYAGNGGGTAAESPVISGERVIETNGHAHLNVPTYNQMTYWLSYSKLRGRVACGVTSVKMVLDYYAHFNYPGLRNETTLENGKYFYRYITYPAKTKSAWTDHLEQGAYVDNGDISANDWEVVRRSIGNYHPVVVYGGWGSTGPHIVVIVGIDDTHITIVDPIHTRGGAIKSLTKDEARQLLRSQRGNYRGQYLINNGPSW